jgi:hypothetical protein
MEVFKQPNRAGRALRKMQDALGILRVNDALLGDCYKADAVKRPEIGPAKRP